MWYTYLNIGYMKDSFIITLDDAVNPDESKQLSAFPYTYVVMRLKRN